VTQCIIGNIDLITATLGAQMLPTVIRGSCDDPRDSRCLLVEIPVPAGITLQSELTMALCVSISGSLITLNIPAVGHIHCATCNHKQEGKGAVWRAAEYW